MRVGYIHHGYTHHGRACSGTPPTEPHSYRTYAHTDTGSELTEVQKAHVARVRLPGELKHGVHHERGRHHGAAGAREEAAHGALQTSQAACW